MRVLLTGATGFVGGRLYPALLAAGCQVRCATRRPDAARHADPARDWVRCDVNQPDSLLAALSGCDAAVYLVHALSQGDDYPRREADGARNVLRAAEDCGVGRIVYLGGVQPSGERASKHLRSRQRTGEILRAGAASTVELQASWGYEGSYGQSLFARLIDWKKECARDPTPAKR